MSKGLRAMGSERQDGIDRFVAGVVKIFPTLDPEVEAAVDRMNKIMKYLDRTTEGNVKVFGLNVGEFKVLLRLREAKDETLSAGAVADMLDLSPSAMTNRLDRLEEDGLVTRARDTEDRRSVLVSLTPRGEEVVGQAVERQAKEESSLLAVLSEADQRRLNALLRALSLEIEDRGFVPPGHHAPAQSEA
jgi:DNA-binding MarR family transcriptional regulator